MRIQVTADRAGRHARQEFRRMPVGEEGDILAHQFGEHAALIVGKDGVRRLLQRHLEP